MSEEVNRYWERIHGFVSEFRIDARWIFKSTEEGDDRAHGSLRIVSNDDLKPGHLKAHWSVVTSRRPKSQEEIEFALEEYQMDETELELYSIHEHVTTHDTTITDRKQSLEEMFGVQVFG